MQKEKSMRRYSLWTLIGVLIASFYPLLMGIRVVVDMIRLGAIDQADYPKYIIPYAPISLAVLTGVLLMPHLIPRRKRFTVRSGYLIAIAVFFAFEWLFEAICFVKQDSSRYSLGAWQMYSCIQISIPQRDLTAIDVLTGNYNPAFKLHFYLISIILILAILNSIYGFGQMVHTGEQKRRKALVIQSVCTAMFLGLCILACFTAFWRDGSLTVSPLSAILMVIFFILLGVTLGMYVGSYLLEKRKWVCIVVPSVAAMLTTTFMYIGELILLDGKLYVLGHGDLFHGIGTSSVSLADILTILTAGLVTAFLCAVIRRQKPLPQQSV